MKKPALHPYARLSPDCVLQALESLGLEPDGRLLALNSFENRVYQVWFEDGTVRVVKFYRPDRWSEAALMEEHAFLAALYEREIPVVPALKLPGQGDNTLFSHDGFRFALFARQSGRAPELADRRTLEWMGRFLGRIHAVGALHPFAHRPTLSPELFGHEPVEWLAAQHLIPPDLRTPWVTTARMALEGVARCFERAGDVAGLRLHGDCHLGNVLWLDEDRAPAGEAGPHFVDFDDARNGPAIQDLWMLLSGDRSEMQGQLLDVLAGYEDFMDFNPRETHLIEALRTLRLIHFSAWIARRWDDPAFPAAFPWFDSPRYWQDRILELREQIALMEEPPIVV